jgi:aspartyl-tRNA(Asn)/glutamyl-tRNA(Gln) amidotransferase subunit B
MTSRYLISGKKDDYEVVIGCEIHAQVASESKLFSSSKVQFGGVPNQFASFVDVAMPGMLPTINQKCVEQAVRTGLAINAKINLTSYFDRKNYFYPDLPQGYQISQFFVPIVEGGEVLIELENGETKNIRIERIHLEQDAGKLIHDQHPNYSLVDLNRAGVPLMEIVSKPDLNSPEEAATYVKTIRSILRAIGSSDADMEKGNLRCDANVSVRKVGEPKLGTRCEIKNLNSTRNIARAIVFEAQRQVELIENGGVVVQETRLFDANSGETATMRSKEDAMDYRYFPDPDLPPLNITQDFVDKIRLELPELPAVKKNRYINQYKLNQEEVAVLLDDVAIAEFFEKVISRNVEAKLAVTWLNVELLGRLNKQNIAFDQMPISLDNFVELLQLITQKTISAKTAKEIFDLMFSSGKNPKKIVSEMGLEQVSDESPIVDAINKVLDLNQDSLAEYFSGKEKLFAFFIGQIMKETRGKANPAMVNDLLKKEIDKRK